MIKPTLVTCHVALNKLNIFKGTKFQQLWGNIFTMKFVLLHHQPRKPVSQTFYHLLDGKMSPYSNPCCHFPECYMSVLSDRLIQFSYISLSRGSSQVTTSGWSARSAFPTLKCFTHHLTLLAPIQCLYMHNVDLLLNRKFHRSMRPKQRPHQPVSHTEIWPHDRDRQDNFHSGVSNNWDYSSTLQYCLAFAHNCRMFMTFSMTTHTYTTLHSVTSQKSIPFTATEVRTLNLTITMVTDQDIVFSKVGARLNYVYAMLRLIHGWHDSHLGSCLWSTSVMAYCRTRCRVRRG